MICTHLKELYQLCESNQLRLGGSDLIRIVCRQCNQEETCPSMLMDAYDENERQQNDDLEGEPPQQKSAEE